MRKLFFIGNIIFFGMVMYFIYDSTRVFFEKKDMQISLAQTEKEIKEFEDKKNKILEDSKSFTDEEKMEKYARDKLNLKKEGEVTYKIVE